MSPKYMQNMYPTSKKNIMCNSSRSNYIVYICKNIYIYIYTYTYIQIHVHIISCDISPYPFHIPSIDPICSNRCCCKNHWHCRMLVICALDPLGMCHTLLYPDISISYRYIKNHSITINSHCNPMISKPTVYPDTHPIRWLGHSK